MYLHLYKKFIQNHIIYLRKNVYRNSWCFSYYNIFSNFQEVFFFLHYIPQQVVDRLRIVPSLIFQQIHRHTIVHIFHILYILTRLWLKLFKQRPTTVTAPKINIRILHYAIAFFVSLESIVLPQNWYGTSIISILVTKK